MHDHPRHADHDQRRHAGDDPLEHRARTSAGPGHNRPKSAAQWQAPHLPGGVARETPVERDLDLVEASFVEGFTRASDPTSFLRLAGIPFVGVDGAGRRLHLLRVETESLTDVGAVAPLLGGAGVRYDPLPAPMVSQRRRLTFVYHDGQDLAHLEFAAARALADQTGAPQPMLSRAG